MEKSYDKKKFAFIFFGFLFILVYILYYVNGLYPFVGHDYRYFLTRLVDNYLHFKVNGLTIQWFSPRFGGGLPAYHNPQQLHFSLIQFLTLFFSPWHANNVSLGIFILVGYFFTYRFARDILDLGWMGSILAAIVFSSNGFYIQHAAAGHVSFHVFPLSVLIIYALFNINIPPLLSGVISGCALGLIVHSGGFIILFIFGFTYAITLPLCYLLKPGSINLRKIFVSTLIGMVISLLLTAGKLYAINSFMKYFPRLVSDSQYYSSHITALAGFIFQFSGVMFFTLPFKIIFNNPDRVVSMMTGLISGSQFGIWEIDTSISAIIPYIFLYEFRKKVKEMRGISVKRVGKRLFQGKRLMAFLFLILFSWITFDLISARGVFYEIMNQLSVLESLHVYSRFSAAFILPFALLGAFFFDREFKEMPSKKRLRTFSFFFLVALVLLGNYNLMSFDIQSRGYQVKRLDEIYFSIKNNDDFSISEIQFVNDTQAFLHQASSLDTFEPIFGYENEEFSARLVPGSIYLEEGGHYNMTNPRSLVYDSEELFTRFTTEEREKLDQFAHYQQPDWDIPPVQYFLNAVSAVTFVGVLGYGLVRLGIWVFRLLKLKRVNESAGG